jgi:hypothetical protein
MLPSLVRFPARPPQHAHFGIRSIDPVHLLSTLQTPRYRDACKTRCWSVCSTLTRPDFHQQADTSFPNAQRIGLPRTGRSRNSSQSYTHAWVTRGGGSSNHDPRARGLRRSRPPAASSVGHDESRQLRITLPLTLRSLPVRVRPTLPSRRVHPHLPLSVSSHEW